MCTLYKLAIFSKVTVMWFLATFVWDTICSSHFVPGSVATILTGLLSFMLEKSPTLGSVETSDYDKKAYAVKSHEFNLRDKTFCELFPEQAEASTAIIERRNRKKVNGAAAAAGAANGETDDDDPLSLARRQLQANNQNGMGSTVANFLVIGGFAAFAFLVQHIVQTIAAAND